MNKFEEYNSSQIVPQRTLLEKFNKLVEYLKQNPSVNLFYVNDNYAENKVYNISDIVTKENLEMQIGDLVVFNNIYYSYVLTIGDENFTVGTATNFKGEQGIQGIQGPQGIQGIQGEKGDTGEKGNTGEKGDTGTSITSVVLNNENQFVISFSDGTSFTTQAITITPSHEIVEVSLSNIQFNSQGQATLYLTLEQFNTLKNAPNAKLILNLSDNITKIEMWRIYSNNLMTFGGVVGNTSYYATMVIANNNVVASAYEKTISKTLYKYTFTGSGDFANDKLEFISKEYFDPSTLEETYDHTYEFLKINLWIRSPHPERYGYIIVLSDNITIVRNGNHYQIMSPEKGIAILNNSVSTAFTQLAEFYNITITEINL